MTATAADCRRILDGALVTAGPLEPGSLAALAGAPADALDQALREFAADHGAGALVVLTALASERADRGVRRAAKRALYRLSQRGVTMPARPAPRPVVEREPERAARAWLSGIDGSGSRAAWILLQGGLGGSRLCSLILNDDAGILEVAGGDITRKRLERELAALRASQKLPWVEVDPARALALVQEALARHAALGTSPPPGFSRWQPSLDRAAGVAGAPAPSTVAVAAGAIDEGAVARSVELLELPEMAGWFLDPEAMQSDAVDLLQTRESRLVVSDQIKAERESAIVDAVIARELTPEVRHRWARRLSEMALLFRATDRAGLAELAETAAATLGDDARDPLHHPFARLLARRGLEMASEVALGRARMADVSRKPVGGDDAPAA